MHSGTVAPGPPSVLNDPLLAAPSAASPLPILDILPAKGLSSQVDLSVACKGLVNNEMFGTIDSFVVVFLKDSLSTSWGKELFRSETQRDKADPHFERNFHMDYFFEENQNLKFAVYNENPGSWQLQDNKLLGECYTTVAEIVGSRGMSITLPLFNPANPEQRSGTINISAEEMQGLQHLVKLQLGFFSLRTGITGISDFCTTFACGQPDQFLLLTRKREDGFSVTIHKSEVCHDSADATWLPFEVTVQKLCNGDEQKEIQADVMMFASSGKHQSIGKCMIRVDELKSAKLMQTKMAAEKAEALMNASHHSLNGLSEEKKEKGPVFIKTYEVKDPDGMLIGTLAVVQFEMREKYSFLDYIKGGCEIGLIVAIDFTQSNGDPNDPRSLHYIRGTAPNEYESAIRAVAEVLAFYDTDKKFPVYGFGAKFGTGEVSHCFALNGTQTGECYGVDGILDAYHQAIKNRNIKLFGPSVFSHVVRAAAQFALDGESADGQHYYILLIITDGVISDMDATIEALVEVSSLPLSIVIVGVGNADFERMDILDADDIDLTYNGVNMARDIVQFVPYRDFRDKHYSALAKETLAEIPGQIVEYMEANDKKPNPAIKESSMRGAASSPDGLQSRTASVLGLPAMRPPGSVPLASRGPAFDFDAHASPVSVNQTWFHHYSSPTFSQANS